MRSKYLCLAASTALALAIGAPVAANSNAAAADSTLAPPEEKKICRASAETGSLIKKRKACLTRAQWKAVDDQHEQEAHKMIQDSTTRPKGE